MRNKTSLLFLTFIICLVGCTNEESRDTEVQSTSGVYIDYIIRGSEESGHVSIRAQFRRGGPDGGSIVLSAPAGVSLDGMPLEPDSSRLNGAWYELMIPSVNLSGYHSIVFTDADSNQYRESFDFNIISLKKAIPGMVERDSLVFELEGLDPGDHINILFTDTSYYSRGIDRTDTVQNGRILITRQELENLKNGPVSVELIKEMSRELQEPTEAGGRITFSYGLKRVFQLID